jgi:hypothetical protein
VKPRITFRGIRPDLASTRLRAEIPQRELAELGIERGRDILVIEHSREWHGALLRANAVVGECPVEMMQRAAVRA